MVNHLQTTQLVDQLKDLLQASLEVDQLKDHLQATQLVGQLKDLRTAIQVDQPKGLQDPDLQDRRVLLEHKDLQVLRVLLEQKDLQVLRVLLEHKDLLDHQVIPVEALNNQQQEGDPDKLIYRRNLVENIFHNHLANLEDPLDHKADLREDNHLLHKDLSFQLVHRESLVDQEQLPQGRVLGHY